MHFLDFFNLICFLLMLFVLISFYLSIFLNLLSAQNFSVDFKFSVKLQICVDNEIHAQVEFYLI